MTNRMLVFFASLGIVVLLASAFTQQNHAANNEPTITNMPMLGEIRLVAFNFNPRGWANCDGQLLPVAKNSDLFSLLGTMYGGDGRTTFGLPDLRGRSAVHIGRPPGLPNIKQGQKDGGIKVGDDADSTTTTQSTLGLRYIIAVQGSYPRRS